MKIVVTHQDRLVGEPCFSYKCPVAQCINRLLKPSFSAHVGLWHIRIVPYDLDNKKAGLPVSAVYSIGMPEVLIEFIQKVDHKELFGIGDIAFEIDDIPQEFLRNGS